LELARDAQMTVGEFLQYVGDRSLVEMRFRVDLANDLGKTLEDIENMPAPELDDWMILYDVEYEAQRLEAENARRRR